LDGGETAYPSCRASCHVPGGVVSPGRRSAPAYARCRPPHHGQKPEADWKLASLGPHFIGPYRSDTPRTRRARYRCRAVPLLTCAALTQARQFRVTPYRVLLGRQIRAVLPGRDRISSRALYHSGGGAVPARRPGARFLAALEEYREWSAAGRPGAISHEQARRLLLGEDGLGSSGRRERSPRPPSSWTTPAA
jgi:hypothetical protein